MGKSGPHQRVIIIIMRKSYR